MARYVIEDTTLTALGDAVRSKIYTGDLKLHWDDLPVIGHNNYYLDFTSMYGNRFRITVDNLTINPDCLGGMLFNYYTPGDTRQQSYFIEKKYSMPHSFELTIDLAQSVWYSCEKTYTTFSLTIESIDENGNPYKFTPMEMVDALKGITPGPSKEDLIITGDCSYRFASGGWDWAVNKYGDAMTTTDVSACRSMFEGCKLRRFPVDINIGGMSPYANGGGITLQYTFKNCEFEELPKFNNMKLYSFTDSLQSMLNLTYIPDDYFTDWDISLLLAGPSVYSANVSGNFSNCYRLTNIPTSYWRLYNPAATGNYATLSSIMNNHCMSDIPNIVWNWPNLECNTAGSGYGSVFYNSFRLIGRLKTLTFAPGQECKWSQQVLDLSQSCGWSPTGSFYFVPQCEVTDDATYQALKDNPNWATSYPEYSRYNHDGAVETINSLPDCSAYQISSGRAANTIKFKGDAGRKTDGGAINTLTEEEIAVAAAKGWTVTLA